MGYLGSDYMDGVRPFPQSWHQRPEGYQVLKYLVSFRPLMPTLGKRPNAVHIIRSKIAHMLANAELASTLSEDNKSSNTVVRRVTNTFLRGYRLPPDQVPIDP